nr:MAG TPA: Protein of unknown function (DUF550) [Caudoviricetes sp.]
MTKSTITRERLQEIAEDGFLKHGESKELARMALAAMDSEPVTWGNGCDKTVPAALRYLAENERPFGGESRFNAAHLYQLAREIELMAEAPLYRHAQQPVVQKIMARLAYLLDEDQFHNIESMVLAAATQPAPERDQVRREHAEWSQATFGDVGPVGPLKHLSKEALEAAADPHDPLEWADMQFLFWDAQRRMGISDEFITRAMVEKLAINKARQWPEPKDGEPRLHIKEQPAPVVPDERAAFNAWNNDENLPIAGVSAKNAAWLAWQARAELTGNSPVIPGAEQRIADAVELLKKAAPAMLADNSGPDGPLAGRLKSPVIPDGWKLVPIIAFPSQWAAGQKALESAGINKVDAVYKAMLAAAPQEVNHG